MAREQKPSIVFIDELDSICGKRTEGENDGTRRIKTEILVQMVRMVLCLDGPCVHVRTARSWPIDGWCPCAGVRFSTLSVFGFGRHSHRATNLPQQLDSAVLRRFEQRIYIGLPSEEARKRLFKLEISSSRSTLTERDLDELAKRTDGYSGSDISQICKKANMTPLRLIMDAQYFKMVEGRWLPAKEGETNARRVRWTDLERQQIGEPALTIDHFYAAIRATQKTVSTKDLAQYRNFQSAGGDNGNGAEDVNRAGR
jgi:vacuolar protein-sorting-associated protein 4